MQATKDLYKLLGLSRGASQEEIRKAHRKLVREYHPDANPGDRSAEERFKDIQQAYEVLSNPHKRQEYDKKLRFSSRGGSSKSPPRADGRTGGESTLKVDLSDLLSKLADLSSDHPARHQESSSQLRGEEVARLAKLLGVDVSRISGLLGNDITHLSKLLGESLKTSVNLSFGDIKAEEFSAKGEDVSARRPSGASNTPRQKRVKGPRARRKEKRVRGPKARRKRRGS
jgi:curved DNA-binding protein CbpA